MRFLQQILKKESVRYVIVLIVGLALGAIFYPTSNLEEKLQKKYQEEVRSLIVAHENERKSLREEINSVNKEYNLFREESDHKVNNLTFEIHNLQNKQKTSYYKLVKPDGTIEVKKFSESEINESSSMIAQIQEEFKTKIESIEQKWESIHKERVESIKRDFLKKEEAYAKTIDELAKTKVVTKNEKSFGVEGGYTSKNQFFLHTTVDLFGPVYMGIHGETDSTVNDSSIGLGLGIKF